MTQTSGQFNKEGLATRPQSPAFPPPDPLTFDSVGLTKREYFAAAALGGYLANPEILIKERSEYSVGMTKDEVATQIVQMVDALIAELNKGGES